MKNKTISVVIIIIFLFIATTCVNAALVVDDWPTFQHDSAHTGYSTETAPDTNHTLWSYKTSGAVGSPVVVDEKVFVCSNNGDIYCLNAYDGSPVWSLFINCTAKTVPTFNNGCIFVGSYGDGNLYCLDALSGEKIWNHPTGSSIYGSPNVAEGLVYFGSCDHNVYALNALTGALSWNYTTGASVNSCPATANGKLYVGSNDRNFYCLDALDGSLVWKYPVGNWVESSPAIADGNVYIGSKDGTLYAFGSTPTTAPTITLQPSSAVQNQTPLETPENLKQTTTILTITVIGVALAFVAVLRLKKKTHKQTLS
ncbi:MAG: PQQ-binding-like beta-propeller repeat protein [Candidatus Bathyarchaeia archaeon]